MQQPEEDWPEDLPAEQLAAVQVDLSEEDQQGYDRLGCNWRVRLDEEVTVAVNVGDMTGGKQAEVGRYDVVDLDRSAGHAQLVNDQSCIEVDCFDEQLDRLCS